MRRWRGVNSTLALRRAGDFVRRVVTPCILAATINGSIDTHITACTMAAHQRVTSRSPFILGASTNHPIHPVWPVLPTTTVVGALR